MRELTVNKKTGFTVLEPNTPINIRDYRGIMFYSSESILPVYTFNLPPGKYMVDSGSFKPMANPVQFTLESLPMAETALPQSIQDFKIVFAPNPNKCTIFWGKKLIVFDTSFEDRPLPELYFIYFHEQGHSKYGFNRLYTMRKAEALCDMYASNQMLRMGFNPSQIIAAPKNTLSSKQDYRKNYIEETLYKNA